MGLGWKETWVNGEAPFQVYTLGWPDFNSDGYPDLWIASHAYFGAPPQLWINQSGKGFQNIITKRPAGADLHCSTWGDFDNDGDPDLYFHAGAASGTTTLPFSRVLYVNENGSLVSRAAQLGLSPDYGSGRNALWFDWNKDGRLDLAVFNETLNLNAVHPSKLFAWRESSFVDVTSEAGIVLNPTGIQKQDSAHFGVLSDLFGDGIPDFMVLDGAINKPGFIVRVYRNETSTLQDITSQFALIKGHDAVVEDFNGDTVSDIFVVNGNGLTESTIFYPTDSGYLMSRMWPPVGGMHGMSFKTSGDISVQCDLCLTPVFIGSQKISPSSLFFTLSPTNPSAQGFAPLSTPGTYINYDSTTGLWTVRTQAPPSPAPKITIKTIDITSSSKSFSEINPINFTVRTEPRTSTAAQLPTYLEYDSTLKKYVNRTTQAGFTKMMGWGVVAGDFDNDMDLDLYVRQINGAGDMPLQSIYLENQGNGTFKEASDLKGATMLLRGPGAAQHSFSVVPMAVADYDLNGFLDIYVAMGDHTMMNKRYYAGQPPRLFKNRGNGNHWLQIDLQGMVSNRDAIGAKVLVRTADGKVQMRMQDGSNHYCSQHQHRLHFGLGTNTTVNSVEVRWPTGNVQIVNDVSIDHVMRIVENTP